MLLLTLLETYAINSFTVSKTQDEKAANLTTALGDQRSCYATE